MLAFLSASVVAGACGTSGSTVGAVRTLVVLTADEATEVVVPAGAFDQPVATTTVPPATTDGVAPESPAKPEPTDPAGGDVSTTEADDPTMTTAPAADTASASTTATPTTAVPTPTTAVPTTTEVPTKETIPLAEEDVHPGVKLMGTLDDFNRCVEGEGWEWLGFPDASLGAEAPVNQPAYLQALQLCNSRTQISQVYQEYQTSRSELTPDEIKQENEDFIELADCLRGLGWEVGELRPDENGLLNPGDSFSGPDGEIVTDDIRDCVSQISLARQGE